MTLRCTSSGHALVTRALHRSPQGLELVSFLGGTSVIGSPQQADATRFDHVSAAGWSPLFDLACDKPCTDLVVHGEAIAPHRRPLRQMTVSVEVPTAGVRVDVRVVGNRTCTSTPTGYVMSEPEPFSQMALDWSLAFGGDGGGARLLASDDAWDDPRALLRVERPPLAEYPRNPVGRGWHVLGGRYDRELRAPNLEAPTRPVRSDDLAPCDGRSWPSRPAPVGFGWVEPTWFPRCAHAGVLPYGTRACELPELDERWRAQFDREDAPPLQFSPLFWSGAAPGLALQPLHGGEPIVLRGFHADAPPAIQLPPPPPPTVVGRRAEIVCRDWVLHTACINASDGQLYCLWRANTVLPSQLQRTPSSRLPMLLEDLIA